MADSTRARRAARPWHLTVVGVLATLWNAVGATDFTATAAHFEPYTALAPREVMDYIYTLPTWHFAVWGVATWGGLLGSLCLILRSKLAVPLLAASLVCASGLMALGILQPGPEGLNDPYFAGAIVVIALTLLLYARWMSISGVLR